MDLARGVMERIDRKLLVGLRQNETYPQTDEPVCQSDMAPLSQVKKPLEEFS